MKCFNMCKTFEHEYTHLLQAGDEQSMTGNQRCWFLPTASRGESLPFPWVIPQLLQSCKYVQARSPNTVSTHVNVPTLYGQMFDTNSRFRKPEDKPATGDRPCMPMYRETQLTTSAWNPKNDVEKIFEAIISNRTNISTDCSLVHRTLNKKRSG